VPGGPLNRHCTARKKEFHSRLIDIRYTAWPGDHRRQNSEQLMKITDCSTRTFVQPPRDPCNLSLPYMSWRKRIQATKAGP
jgi:hypothetical protein